MWAMGKPGAFSQSRQKLTVSNSVTRRVPTVNLSIAVLPQAHITLSLAMVPLSRGMEVVKM